VRRDEEQEGGRVGGGREKEEKEKGSCPTMSSELTGNDAIRQRVLDADSVMRLLELDRHAMRAGTPPNDTMACELSSSSARFDSICGSGRSTAAAAACQPWTHGGSDVTPAVSPT
jgi:hypothetical protein